MCAASIPVSWRICNPGGYLHACKNHDPGARLCERLVRLSPDFGLCNERILSCEIWIPSSTL